MRLLSILFILPLLGIAELAFSNDFPGWMPLEKALLRPHEATTLELDLTEDRTRSFYDNVRSFRNVQSIRVSAYMTDMQVREFLVHAELLEHLKELELVMTGVDQLPAEIQRLKHLRELRLVPEDAAQQWLNAVAVQIDYVSEAHEKSDFVLSVYNSEALSDRDISRLVKYYPDALVERLAPDATPDFVYMPGKVRSVRPGIQGLDVEQTTVSVNSTTGSQLYFESGTVINVPENAFVDAAGSVIDAEVTLQYREFSDPTEMLVSGVPMDYDTAGMKTYFTSAGMFELTASVDGEEVFMNPDVQVQIDLVTSDTATDYNLYYLDPASGKWVYENSEVNVVETTLVQPLSNAWVYFNRENGSGLLSRTFDELTFEERWENDAYSFLYRFDEDDPRTIYGLPGKMIVGEQYIDWSESPQVRLTLTQDFAVVDGEVEFTLEGSARTYPELRAFKNMTWRYTGDLTRQQFKQQILKDQAYTDFRVSYDASSANYTLTLKDQQGKVTLTMESNYSSNTTEQQKEDLRRIARYDLTLERKTRTINKELVKDAIRFQRQQDHAWFSVGLHMSPEEQKMTRETWLEYYAYMTDAYGFLLNDRGFDVTASIENMEANRAINRRIAASNARGRRRGISIDLFGFVNIDKSARPFEITPLENDADELLANRPMRINASFVGRDQQRLQVKSVFVFAEGHNGVLRFDVEQGQREVELLYNPNIATTIVTVDYAGNLAVMRPRKVAQLDRNPDTVMNNILEMKELHQKFTSVEEVRKFLRVG